MTRRARGKHAGLFVFFVFRRHRRRHRRRRFDLEKLMKLPLFSFQPSLPIQTRYLDAFAGIVTVSVGHCHPRVLRAIQDQQVRRFFLLFFLRGSFSFFQRSSSSSFFRSSKFKKKKRKKLKKTTEPPPAHHHHLPPPRSRPLRPGAHLQASSGTRRRLLHQFRNRGQRPSHPARPGFD